MNPYVIGGFALSLFVLIIFVAHYNGLVNLKNLIVDSWANVDTELKRRYDLIPNLVSTVKGYAAHEKDVLERVIQARNQISSQGDVSNRSNTEQEMMKTVKTLFALVEKYPQIKADKNFLQLQRELINTEDRIQAARRFFNANVRDYNNKVQMFPSNIVASFFAFKRADFFETEDVELPKVVL